MDTVSHDTSTTEHYGLVKKNKTDRPLYADVE